MAMSMRSRGGSTTNRSRHGVRPVYEEFQPMSEWKHEEGADILLYHLPGFVKEQIRILAESKRVLRLFGERFIGGNKWSRFQDEIVVPEDCNMSEIRARFEVGILRIIMPKKTITPSGKRTSAEDREAPKTSMPKPDLHTPTQGQDQSGVAQGAPITSMPKPDLHTPYQSGAAQGAVKTSMPKPELQTKPEKLQESTSTNDQNRARVQEEDRKHEETFDHDKEKTIETYTRGKEETPNAKETSEVLGKKKETNYRPEEMNKGVIKSPLPRSLDEDRQLLVNMGVAVLVIVGLGAYISYSLGSSI